MSVSPTSFNSIFHTVIRDFFNSLQKASDTFPSLEKETSKDPNLLHVHPLCIKDHLLLTREKKGIIGGYLNLSAADGWDEGHDIRLGISFTSYILYNYFFQNEGHLGNNAVVFEKTIKAFKDCANCDISLFAEKKEICHLPKESRIRYDSSVVGWQRHAVNRLVGNLGSSYDPLKPFFEILVNSARSSHEDPLCKPFCISIHANEAELEKRRRTLSSLTLVPAEISAWSFYPPYLKKPKAFLENPSLKLGPNSVQLLQGLIYLENVTLNAQTVGNCWIKQPMRCLLACLYIELITCRPELSPASAWTEAKELYKTIQRTIAIPFVEQLLDSSDATNEMKKTALDGLEKQKKL